LECYRASSNLLQPATLDSIAEELLQTWITSYTDKTEAIPVSDFLEFNLNRDFLTTFQVRDIDHTKEAETYPSDSTNPIRILVSPATYNLLGREQPRARFTIAHEIGHSILHFWLERRALLRDRFCEHEANSFAASLLMPRELIRKLMATKNADSNWIAGNLRVSKRAAHLRIQQLGYC